MLNVLTTTKLNLWGRAYWLIWRNTGDDGWQVGLDPDVPVMLLALSHSHLSVQLLSVLFSPSFLV